MKMAILTEVDCYYRAILMTFLINTFISLKYIHLHKYCKE